MVHFNSSKWEWNLKHEKTSKHPFNIWKLSQKSEENKWRLTNPYRIIDKIHKGVGTYKKMLTVNAWKQSVHQALLQREYTKNGLNWCMLTTFFILCKQFFCPYAKFTLQKDFLNFFFVLYKIVPKLWESFYFLFKKYFLFLDRYFGIDNNLQHTKGGHQPTNRNSKTYRIINVKVWT